MNYRLNKQHLKLKIGFTLAEVLITLGIIGIVAMMTIPVLMKEYKKQVLSTRIKKFYTNWKQASKIDKLASADWDTSMFTQANNPDETMAFYDANIGPYIRTIETGKLTKGIYGIFSDGAGFYILKNKYSATSTNRLANTYVFFCVYGDDCKNMDETYSAVNYHLRADGVKIFSFYINGEPETYLWDGTRTMAHDNCAGTKPTWCSTLLRMDNWEVLDDYPKNY